MESRLISKAISKFALLALSGEPDRLPDLRKRPHIAECCSILGLDYVQEAETVSLSAVPA